MTDEAVIELTLKGNNHIFSEIVNKYKDKVFSMAYRFTNEYGEAQDLSQEVFINVYKNLHLFNHKCKFSTWIYRVCYNLSIDWIRKNKCRLKQQCIEERIYNKESSEPEDTGFNLEEDCLIKQERMAVRYAVDNMDEKYRNVLILFHYQELSYEDIAEILKVPVKTVETRLHRGRNLLKKYLKKYEYGGEFYEMPAGN